jgi:hypothetical protein
MNAKQKLDKKLNKLLGSRGAFVKHFTLKDLEAYIDILLASHINIKVATRNIPDRIFNRLGPVLSAKSSVSKPGFKEYNLYKLALANPVKILEDRTAMSSLVNANDAYIGILNELKDNLSVYFTSDKINLFNMKLSHVVIMSVLYQSERLSTFSKYMLSIVTSCITGSTKEIPQYQLQYCSDNYKELAITISELMNNSGEKNFGKIINNIKIKADDFTLISDDSKSQVGRMNIKGLTSSEDKLLSRGVRGLYLPRKIGEMINNKRNDKHNHLKNEEEWLRAQMALVIAKMERIDEDSPEYIKLKNVVSKYNDLINKYERKQKKYED